jgi:hypothetical protein
MDTAMMNALYAVIRQGEYGIAQGGSPVLTLNDSLHDHCSSD